MTLNDYDAKSICTEIKNNLHPCDVNNNGTTIAISDADGIEKFDRVKLTVGSTEFVVDDVDCTVSLPAVNRNGTVYVDIQTIKAILNFEFESAHIKYLSQSYSDAFAGKKGIYSKFA